MRSASSSALHRGRSDHFPEFSQVVGKQSISNFQIENSMSSIMEYHIFSRKWTIFENHLTSSSSRKPEQLAGWSTEPMSSLTMLLSSSLRSLRVTAVVAKVTSITRLEGPSHGHPGDVPGILNYLK